MGIFKKLFKNKSKASKAAKRYDQRTEQNRGKTLKKSSGVKNNADGIKTVGKTKTAPTVKNVKKTANHGGNGGKFNTAKGNVERVNTVQSNVKAVSENKQKPTYSGMVAKDYQQKNSVIQKSKNDFKTEIESKLKNDGLKKNDFYSEKTRELQKKADSNLVSPRKRQFYKKMAVDAVHQESFDKIKTAHPEIKDEDIERYLKTLDSYGKQFQNKSAKAEKEAVQKNLDKIYEDVLKLRQDMSSKNIDYSTAQGQAAAKVMAFKNLELGGTPFETVNSKLAYEKVARNSKNDVLTAEAKKRAKKADDVLLKSLWAGGGDLVENVIPALAPYRNYAEGQKAKGNDVPASNFDENGYYKGGGVANKFYNLVHAGTEKAQAEFDDAMAAGNGNLAKEFGGTAIYGTFQMVFDMLGMAFGSTETKVVANAPKALKAVHTAATATKNAAKDSGTVKAVSGKVLDVFGVAKDGVADLLKNPANLSRINLYHEQQLSANLQSGMDYDTANTQAWLYAVPAALVETGGVQKNIVEKASDTVLGKNKISTMETIANVLKNNFLPEAREEVVQEGLSDIGMGAVGEKVEFEPKKYAMAAAVGGTLGGAMGGPIEVYNSAVNNNTYYHNEMLKQKIADGLGISTDAVQAAIDDGSLREKVDTANEQMNAVGEYIKACKTEDVSPKAISKIADSTAQQKVNAITESEFGGSFVITKNAIDRMVRNGATESQITKVGIINSRPDYVFTTPIVKSVKKSSQKSAKKSAVNKNAAVNETAANKMMTFVKVFGDEVYFVNQEVQGENIVPVGLQAMSYEKAVETVEKMDLPQAEKSTIIKKIGDSANITVGGIVNGIRLNNQQMKTYRVFSTFANAKGGSVEVRNDLAPGNPGQIIKNNDGTFKIVLSDESLRNYVTAGHEFTHAIEGSEEYFELLDFIKQNIAEKGIDYNTLIAEIKEDYSKSGATLDDALAERELMSIFCAKHMFDDQKLINRLANEHPNIVERMMEWLSDMISKLKNITDADAKFYIDARNKYVQAFRSITQEQRKADFGRLNGDGESVRHDSIVVGSKGKYVKADREIDWGDDESLWSEKMGEYVYDHILHNGKLDVKTDDGDVLTIDGRTEWKLRDNQKTVNGKPIEMSREEFKQKMTAAIHIDELAEISTRGKKTVEDRKNHFFAKDGFNYRTAYIEMSNGDYFKLKLSVGKNGTVKTVYNIGNIQKRSNPNVNGSSSSRGGSAPAVQPYGSTRTGQIGNGVAFVNKIPQTKPKVKEKKSIELAFEKSGIIDSIYSNSENDTTVKSNSKNSIKQNMFVSADENIAGMADEMELKGASEEEIWRELGVVRTMDGKGWRSEIDDSTAKINPRGALNSKAGMEIDEIYSKIFGGNVTQEEWNKYNDRLKALEKEFTPKKKGKLSDFLEHDVLYEKYPFLKNYKIEFEKQGNQDYRGRINPTYKVLTIVENSKREYLGTLLHEVQHAIQLYEKWPGGANFDFWVKQISKEYANDPKNVSIKAERLFHNVMKNLPAADKPKAKLYFDLAMQTDRLINDGRFDDAAALEAESDALYAEIYHKPWFDNLNTIFNVRENPQEFINDFCKYLYVNTAGEIEARDTAKRSRMTAEERKKNLPRQADEKTVYAEDGVVGFDTNNKKSQKSIGTDIDEKLNRLSDGKWSEAVKSFDKVKKKIKFDDDVEVKTNNNVDENAESVAENAEVVGENAEVVGENAEVVGENAEVVNESAESKSKENRIVAKSKNSARKNTSNAEKYKVSADEAKLYFSKHKKTVSAEEYKKYVADDRHITDGYEGIVFSKKLSDGRYELRKNIADIFQCRGEACINAAEVIDDFVLIQKTRIDKSQRDALFSIFESEIMENAEADAEILTKKRRTFDYYIDCLEAVVGAKGDVAKNAEKPKSELPKQNSAREYLAANGDSVEISVNRAFSISGIMLVDINTSESGKKTSVEVLKNRVFAELPENEKIDFIKLKKSADEPDYITVSRYNALSVEKYFDAKILPLKLQLKELKLTKNENDFVISIIKNDSKMPSVPKTLSDASLDKVNKAVNIKNQMQKELSVFDNIVHRVPYDPLAMHYASQIDAGGKLASAVSNTKNIYDNFETGLRNADQECKDYFDKVIFEPLRNAKRDFVHGIEEKSAMLKKHVIDYGIYGGTKESAALQWYGEGKKLVKQGKNYVEVYYGLEDLKAEFGNAKKNGRYVWENIVEADNFIRKQYDDYADSINDVLRVIYPNPYDENGNIIPGRRLLKRYDYYHHFNDESMGFQSISDVLINTGTEIDPHLLGISEDTKPKTKWTGFLQHRSPDGKYKADAVGGFIRYMQLAEYKLAIEPLIPEYRRKLEAMKDGAAESRKTAQKADTAEQNKNNSRKKKKNAQKNNSVYEKDYESNNEYGEENTADTKDGKTMKNGLLDAFDRFINELAGKSNGVDRAVYHFLGDAKGREALNFLTKFQGKAKAAAIAGNVATMIVQSANAKNFLPVVSKKSLAKGLAQIRSLQICGKLGNHNQNTIDVMKESVFLNERFLQRNYRGFEKGKFLGHNDFIFSTASDLATYGLEIGDEIVCKVGWLGAYYDALKKGEADPIRYADDITRNAVAGRGIGELPPVVKSRLVNAIIPFQVEVLNNLNVRKRIWKSGSPGKVMLGFVNLYLGTFILNELYELLLGRRIDFDPIDAIISIINAWDDDEESYYDQKGYAEYEQAGMMHDENYKGDEADRENAFVTNAFKAVDALLTLSGEWLANMPFASFFAGILAENDDINKVFNNKFGDSSPNRYGDGLIGIKTVFKEVGKFIDGQNVNWKNLIFSYVKYGKQISRVLDFFEDYNIIPDINMNKKDGIWINGHSLDGTFEFLGDQTGRFSDWGTLSYPLDKNFEDMARDLLFGGVTTFSGREWVDSDFTSGLDEFQTAAWKSLVNQGYSSTSAHGLVRLISSIPKNSYNYLGQAYFVENADVDDDCKADLWYNLVFSNKDRLEFNYLLDNGATKAGVYKFYDYIAKVNALNGGWSKIDYAKALSLTGMSDAEQCKVYFDKYVPDYTMKVYDQFIEKGFSKQDIFDVVKLGFSLDWKPSDPDDIKRYNTYLQKAMETIEPKYILMTIGARATFNEQNSMQPWLDEWAGSDRIKTMINSFNLTAGQKDTLNTIIYNKGSLYYSPWRGKPVRWKGDPIPNDFMWDVEGKNAYTPDRVRDFLNDGGYADANKYVKKFESLMKATAASKNKDVFNKQNQKTSMDYIQKRMDKIFNPSGRSYFGR